MPSRIDLPTYLTGTAYFRPPNPPRSDHPAHLHKVKNELGFDIVRLRMQWNAIHRGPDRFDWDEYDEIADICEKVGLLLLLETSLESAPYWLERAHPECRYVSANGQAFELSGYESTQFGGYPGLCFHHEAVQESGKRYLTELAAHFRSRGNVYCYDCWNEPHLEPAWLCRYWANLGDKLFCYCRACRGLFRNWLNGRYGTVEVVNATWGRAYGEWLDINPPAQSGTYSDWLDWGRFWFDQLQKHMLWRYSILKAADPSHPVMSHSGAVPPFLARPNAYIHNWKLAKPVDFWGTSFAPKGHNWRLSECAGTMDATRSAAMDLPFWVSEMSGGACNIRGFAKTPPPRPQDYAVWNWLAAAYGAKATLYWCYLEESTGAESTGYGLVRANGEITPRARAASETAALLREYGHIIRGFMPKPQVGILYDPDNSTQLFAMEGGDELYVQSHVGYYRAVWRTDLYARYVTYDTLDRLAEVKVLLVPMCLTLPERVARQIKEFVGRGGVLIAEARTGLYDFRGYNQPVLPPYELTEVVGAVEGEALYSDPDNRPAINNPRQEPWPETLHNGPEITFEEWAGTAFRARGFFVPLQPSSGRPMASSQGHCLAVSNAYGDGIAYYLGTYVGLALAHDDTGAVTMMQRLLSRHTQPEVTAVNLRPRWIEGPGQSLLVVFNDSRTETRRETIRLPMPCSRALDVYRKRGLAIQDQSINLEVEPEGVAVIMLAEG